MILSRYSFFGIFRISDLVNLHEDERQTLLKKSMKERKHMDKNQDAQCTNDMTFFISADTDNHRCNPIFISADTDKLPIQFFLYRPIPIPITDITSFVIYAFFIMLNVYFLPSKLGDAGGASTPTHFCPSRGFLL